MKVVCNSTVLIGLTKVNKLSLLHSLFSDIFIPESVYSEVVIEGEGRPGAREVGKASWLHRESVQDKISVKMFSRQLDMGEAEVLVLAREIDADLLIIDESAARNLGAAAGYRIIGLVGILVLAKRQNLLPKVKPILDELITKKFRIDKKIYERGLQLAGED